MKRIFALVLCVLLVIGITSIAYATEDETDAPDIAESVLTTEETASEEITVEEPTEPEMTEPETTESEEPEPEGPEATEEIVPEATEAEETPEDGLPEEPEEETIPEISLSQLLAEAADSEEITVDTAVVVDEDTELPEGMSLTVTAGTLRIQDGITLANSGCIRITGGEVVVEDGAVLENPGFIEACENGRLTVSGEADYAAEETGVLSLNVCAEDAEAAIEGVDTAMYEYTVPVYSASELLDAVSSNVYAFKTVCISDFSVMTGLGAFSMSDNVAISFVG